MISTSLKSTLLVAYVLLSAVAPSFGTFHHPSSEAAVKQPVLIAQRSRIQRIRFKPGESSATVQTAVIRGTRDIYLLGAQKGQVMTIKIESVENNAVFDVEAPPTKSGQRRVLKQEAVSWSSKLPETGDYQIVIGSTRGNATYRLQVSIR